MRLIHLIFLTIFSVLSFACLLALIFSVKKTIGTFIIFLIFAAPAGLFYFLYKKASKRAEDNLEKNLAQEKEEWTIYLKENEISLREYSQEIDSILLSRYHFKSHYRPKPLVPEAFDYLEIDITLHKQRKSPQEAAQIIYNEVVNAGDNGNPEIFKESYSLKTFPQFYKFNKILFGSYNPPKSAVILSLLFTAVLALLLYGTPQIYLGPNRDVFIPSPEWVLFVMPIIGILTLLTGYLSFKNKKSQKRISGKYGYVGFIIFQLFILPICFGIFYYAFTVGAGKMLNEIVGKEKILPLLITKNLDTSKHVGRSGSATGYCVKVTMDSNSKSRNEYCLQKQHYDMIPDTSPRIMRFHGTISYFGYRIDGYYEGAPTMRDILKDPIHTFKKYSQEPTLLEP